MADFSRDLSRATSGLAEAIDQFDRRMTKAAAKPSVIRRLARPLPVRAAPTHRPTRYPVALPVALPVRYRRAAAPTALDRVRANDNRRPGGPSRVAAAVKRAGARATGAVRNSLTKLRSGLLRLGGRTGPRA